MRNHGASMRTNLKLLAPAMLLALTACNSIKPETTSNLGAGQTQMVKQFKSQKTQTFKINYLLFLPQGYEAKSEKRWPLILFLHGAGERGTNIWKVATHGPPKNVQEHPDFPFIVVSPQCPDGEHWSNEILLALLEQTVRDYAVDTNRIYLTGLSMGVCCSWVLWVTYKVKISS